MDYPFSKTIHVLSPPIDEVIASTIVELRQSLEEHEVYQIYKAWCSDQQLHRFLIARNYNVKAASELTLSALKWRVTRVPVDGIESMPGWMERMSKEGETGKIYIAGSDKYDRPTLVFDNTVQNTSSQDDQLAFLAWNLEYACRMMPPHVDKYVVFMHLETFSIFNCPAMKTVMETIFMVCSAFPERLGHCIAYRAPGVFKTVFNGVKGFIDPKTVSKLIFITGDVSDGSENDTLLKSLICDDWKVLCGGEQPILKKGNTPGYDHDVHWPMTMARYREVIDRENREKAAAIATAAAASAPLPTHIIPVSEEVFEVVSEEVQAATWSAVEEGAELETGDLVEEAEKAANIHKLLYSVALPALPYEASGLEPHISAEIIQFHYGKHHQNYVNKTKALTSGTSLQDADLLTIIRNAAKDPSSQDLFNNAAQCFNHSFFWLSMSPTGGGEPRGRIAVLIHAVWDNYAAFRSEFVSKALSTFGSGWVWLVWTPIGLKIITTQGAGTPLVSSSSVPEVPVLLLDVWEHAYYLQYQNDRGSFVNTFLDNLVNWDFVNSQLPHHAHF